MKRILIVDKEPSFCALQKDFLTSKGYEVSVALGGKEALGRVREVDLILLSLDLPDMDSMEILKKARELKGNILIIGVASLSQVALGSNALRLGASDCVLRTFKPDTIEFAISSALENKKNDIDSLFYPDKNYGYYHIFGVSKPMQKVFEMADKISKNPASMVLIEGESGTGKELIARMIHYNSGGSKGLFVPVGCSAIPSTLLESELFGYEKGAFTDAKRQKRGLIEEANGGTLFLDEIGDMDLLLQGKILRLLQERNFRRLGGNQIINVDLRVIATTNHNLEEGVKNKTFREDLYYRLKVISIHLPPLRERREEEIIPLAKCFVREFNRKFNKKVRGFAPETETLLKRYPWRGNIRELKNVMERIVTLEDCELILPEHLPQEILKGAEMEVDNLLLSKLLDMFPERIPFQELTQALQKEAIKRAFMRNKGNIATAAKLLGLNHSTLYYQIKRLGLQDLLESKQFV